MSLEDGTIKGFDIRTAKSDPDSTSQQSSFTLHAHDKAVCTISYNPLVPNVHFYPFLNFFSFWGGSKLFLFIHYNNYTYDFLQLLATGSTDKMVSSFLIFLGLMDLLHLSACERVPWFYWALHLVQVKLWDLSNNQPSCIASRNPKAVSDSFLKTLWVTNAFCVTYD